MKLLLLREKPELSKLLCEDSSEEGRFDKVETTQTHRNRN